MGAPKGATLQLPGAKTPGWAVGWAAHPDRHKLVPAPPLPVWGPATGCKLGPARVKMALMSQMVLFFRREALEWPGPQAWCPAETQAHEGRERAAFPEPPSPQGSGPHSPARPLPRMGPRPPWAWRLAGRRDEVCLPRGRGFKRGGTGIANRVKYSLENNKPMMFCLEGLFQGLKRSQGTADPRPSGLASRSSH